MNKRYFLQLLFHKLLLLESDRERRRSLLILLQGYMNHSLPRAQLQRELRNLVRLSDMKVALQQMAEVRDQLLENSALRHAYLSKYLR